MPNGGFDTKENQFSTLGKELADFLIAVHAESVDRRENVFEIVLDDNHRGLTLTDDQGEPAVLRFPKVFLGAFNAEDFIAVQPVQLAIHEKITAVTRFRLTAEGSRTTVTIETVNAITVKVVFKSVS